MANNRMLLAAALIVLIAAVVILESAPLAQRFPPPYAQLRSAWADDLEAHRLAPSVAHYTPDATFTNPDGTHVHGAPAITSLFTTVFNAFSAHITFNSRITERSGDLAYDSGSYRETILERTTLAVHDLSGDYLTVYRREPDGQWRIVQQVWTEATPAK